MVFASAHSVSSASAEGPSGCQKSTRTSIPRDVALSRRSKKVPLPFGNVASCSRKATHTHTDDVADSIVEAMRSNAVSPSTSGVIAFPSFGGKTADSGIGMDIY